MSKKIKYYVQTWIPAYEKPPEDPSLLSETYEEALAELNQAKLLQPENKYQIITIKVNDKNTNLKEVENENK